jgi:hypothetical protein
MRVALPCLFVLLLATAARAEDAPISDEAREHFEAGVALLDDPEGPRYEDAYRAFQAAYAASLSPEILGNLGLCAMQLERDGEAIDAYRRYLVEAKDIEARERAQIQRDLEVLETSAVPLLLRGLPAGSRVVDERIPLHGDSVRNVYGPAEGDLSLRIRAGTHRVTVEHDVHDDVVFDLQAEPGTPLDRAVTLATPSLPPVRAMLSTPAEPPIERTSSLSPGFWVGLALTTALGGATAITGGMAAVRHGEWQDAREAGEVGRAEDIRAEGERINIAADVLLGITVVTATVTAIVLGVDLAAGDPQAAAIRF